MVEVIVFAEGQSEEAFIKRVVAPALHSSGIYLKPQLMTTSSNGKGGAINFDRLCHNVRNTLRQYPVAYLTTFFDLYALDTGMPGLANMPKLSEPVHKAMHVESALHAALVQKLDMSRPERFIAYVQPYELEGLFFSNTEALSRTIPGWDRAAEALLRVRESFETPEHINDGHATKPSARLERLLRPSYRKVKHAPQIGQKIGLSAIVAECPHFATWVTRLGQLQSL